MKSLKTLCGETFTVDDDVFEWANRYNWRICPGDRVVCSQRIGDERELWIARIIVDGFHNKTRRTIRFLDGNRLNLQRENLSLTNATIREVDDYMIALLPNGKEFKFDRIDKSLINGSFWSITKAGYVTRVLLEERDYLHRIIKNAKSDSLEVDHINGDSLDNRRTNLRVCTHQENMRNRKKDSKGVRTKSKFKGPILTKTGNYSVKFPGLYVGTFTSELAAANMYNYTATKLYGRYAKLNDCAAMSFAECLKYMV